MDSGHRILPHTADLALEAWAPTPEECVAEAVHALVESFADLAGPTPTERVTLTVPPGPPEDLLVSVLDEVIYQAEVHGRLPVEASLGDRMTDGTKVRFATVAAEDVEIIGAVPKAVALHELSFTPAETGWRCHVTIDV